ncbi:hypothetical protein C5748_27040 [Phyllobacterium phragmitis]|uniref:Uncharacterized protein n=1 Tax=Phyllobacterium phragmitis TaxID=2670329 RepID=A0A2S9IIU3_9HYPH|nr:hypothetical protein C5748_27040 [Phyllobacterium phragmitis]
MDYLGIRLSGEEGFIAWNRCMDLRAVIIVQLAPRIESFLLRHVGMGRIIMPQSIECFRIADPIFLPLRSMVRTRFGQRIFNWIVYWTVRLNVVQCLSVVRFSTFWKDVQCLFGSY